MTAADLVSDLTQVLYVAAFVGTLVELARRPRKASVDAALFFGILAVVVVTADASLSLPPLRLRVDSAPRQPSPDPFPDVPTPPPLTLS